MPSLAFHARALLLFAALPLLAAAPPAAGSYEGLFQAAVFIDATGPHLATFAYDGDCWGPGVVTLTIHRPAGDDVRVVPVHSFSPDTCGSHISCADCPPVPNAYVWTLVNLDENVALAGGGPSAYSQYQNWPVAYSLSGPFQEGVLQAVGTI